MMIMAVKKSHPKFSVPNYGAKSRKGVKARWRKQHGIDNKKKIGRIGYGASPSIGYKNAVQFRFARPDGMWEQVVNNEKELIAVPRDGKHVAVFAHGLSTKKRTFLLKIANTNKIRVVNAV